MNEELYRELLVASAVVNAGCWMDSCDVGQPNFNCYLASLFRYAEIESLAKKVTIDEEMTAYERAWIMYEILNA